jgi:HSP20 family molecular chaperone IbpA
VKKENITLEAEGQVLRINVSTGEQNDTDQTDAAGITWHRVERSSNFSSRALRFPDSADLSSAKRRARARL